jgi:hypothetical protein
MDLSLKSELDDLFENIKKQTSTLQNKLLQSGAVEDFTIYKVSKKQGGREVVEINTLKEALAVYSDYECVAPDSSKESSLFPGYIALNKDKVTQEGFDEIVANINLAKKQFKSFLDEHNKPKAIMLSQGPKVKLNPILYEAYPMKSPVQIFRMVKYFEPVINMIHFKWVRKQRYDNLTAESAVRIAIFNIDKPPALQYSSAAWRSKMNDLIDKLTALPPDVKLKRIKPAPYTPQLALRITDSGRWQKLHGALPVLVNCESAEQLKLTAGLDDLHEVKILDADGLANLGWKAICSELGFYRNNKSM